MADDDEDDRFFFARALGRTSVPNKLKIVQDGEILMAYLSASPKNMPDILFLDINMPRKNGLECLTEIKSNKAMMHLPVVIYSTSLTEAGADEVYQKGAHYYIRKCDFSELVKYLQFVLTELTGTTFERVSRDKFVLNLQ